MRVPCFSNILNMVDFPTAKVNTFILLILLKTSSSKRLPIKNRSNFIIRIHPSDSATIMRSATTANVPKASKIAMINHFSRRDSHSKTITHYLYSHHCSWSFTRRIHCTLPHDTSLVQSHLSISFRIFPQTTLISQADSFRRYSHINMQSKKFSSEYLENDELLFQRIACEKCTVFDVIQTSIELLDKHSIPEPEESVLHLLSHALNLNWNNGHCQLREVMMMTLPPATTKPMLERSLALRQLTLQQCTTYISYIKRRLQFEPLQYIIGKWDFHNLIGLMIKKPMLCPRPETEELVELVLTDIRRLIRSREINHKMNTFNKIRILDVGCGTGAIGIALAQNYPRHVEIVALDVLQEAVDLSNQNAGKFLSRFIESSSNAECNDISSLYQSILCSAENFSDAPMNGSRKHHETLQFEMGFDIVVSNPPYIPLCKMTELSLDVVNYESRDALCGGDEGLDVIKQIVLKLPEWMSHLPKVESAKLLPVNKIEEQRYCWMEVDDSHPTLLQQWLAPGSSESKQYKVEYCDAFTDFSGFPRFVKLRVL